MPAALEQKYQSPVVVRGLYGYDVEGLGWVQPHAVILRGRRKVDGLAVLIKLLRDSASANDWGSDWLQRDYRIAQSLQAKSAVRPIAFERTDLGPALIYEDDGVRPLEDATANGPLDVVSVLEIGVGVAEAVAALHKERLVHCALNSTTIWLKGDSSVVVSSFGRARYLSEDAPLVVPVAEDLIDVRYVSPEQTGRLGSSVDQRSDIYSIGIILYRLLTGAVPFDGTDPMHIIDGHVARHPVFPSGLPPGLAKVVLKALAKDPEARYLSANGLLADLSECRSQWRVSGAIDEFEPGRSDTKSVLRISRRLYGREREFAMLLEKARSAKNAPATMFLISGAPGAGKSALVNQLAGVVRKESGRFVLGKFDQYNRSAPYLALVQALQQLIGQLLTETKEQLEAWRSRILSAVGDNAQVVIDLIPELERITGSQPTIPSLPPVQARNRFNRVFTKLLQAFAPRDELLCVVLDDLQWVDEASLALLSHVLTEPDTRNILLLGAFRDEEVGPAHPLETTIRGLKQSGTEIELVHIGSLSEHDLLQFIEDTFSTSADAARSLARLLHSKSGGNPLFLTQFLPYLCDEGLIAFDHGGGQWTWDLSRIQREAVTDDILDLLHKRLAGLHEDARAILATAACLGTSFEVAKVATAAGHSTADVLQCTRLATSEELIVAVEALHPTSDPDSLRETKQASRFRFLHDRIQQAAFDYVSKDAQKDFRLQIGRRLIGVLNPNDEYLPQPEILSNVNFAWDLIADEKEKECIARLNLVAGRRARQALAYQDALSYLLVGLDLLGKRSWSTYYDLTFALHSEALECEYLTANFERAEQLFKTLIANAKSKLEKARIYRTKIVLDTSEDRHEQAIKVGAEALKLFGIRYLRKPSKLDLLIQLTLVRTRMRDRKAQDLLDAPSLDDAEKNAVLRLLVALVPTAYFYSPDLFMFTALKIVNLSLRHGISPISAAGFVVYGVALGAAMDDFESGYEFGRLALELAERGKDPSMTCKVLWIFAGTIKPWRDPFDEIFPLADRARKLALEAGDHQYANWAISTSLLPRVTSRGTSLEDTLRLHEEHCAFVQRSKEAFTVELLKFMCQCIRALQGKTVAPHSLSDETYDEIASEHHYRRTGNLTLAFFQVNVRLLLACLFGRTEEALSLSDKGEALVRSGFGFTQVADHYFYRGLTAAVALNTSAAEAARHRRTLRHALARLHLFAANSPHNFRQLESLLEAETARVEGSFADALKQYNRAVGLAEAEGFTHLVGLANERAAQLCLANDQGRLAGWYLSCARAAYDKWGSSAKVAALDRDHAGLLSIAAPASNGRAPASNTRAVLRQGESFDIAAALQASRIIASGKSADLVLTHLMQVIRIQAGAETAHLLVLEGGKLRLEASATVDSGGVVLFPTPSADSGQGSYSPAIVNYVTHTGEDLLVVEAGADARFAQCSYVANRRPRSIACSSIHHQGELLGVIYLEHTQIVGAFGGQKLEWLRLLATEVGLTVWSARLSRYRDYVHRFAPPTVAREIDANPTSPDLTAKDCDVSILFGDLAGYTRMAELMDRRQLDEFVNRAFSRFIDEIHRYEGTLLEIRGDELFVLFMDKDPSRHVRKAASAALAISRAATGLREELSGSHVPVILNMGIHSGIASVGMKAVDAASGARWRYGASGAVVNIAARVRELARDGSILMTADSVARVPKDFVTEDTGEHSLKNVMHPVRVYRLLGERADALHG